MSEKVLFLRGSIRPRKVPSRGAAGAAEVFAGRQHLAMLLWVVVEIIIVLSDPWTGKNRNRSSAVFRRLASPHCCHIRGVWRHFCVCAANISCSSRCNASEPWGNET
jgi:hypothetical protein